MNTSLTFYWICSEDEDNAEYLRSVGVTLGTRVGDYWHNCIIPTESFADLDSHWGVELMWGEEAAIPKTRWEAVARNRVLCSACGCVIRIDGSCSYPLCEPPKRKASLRK